MNTLSSFFARTSTTDLDSCDQEQIHLLGTIQHEGAMLVVRQDTHRIVAFSENTIDIFGFDGIELQSAALHQLHAELSDTLNNLDIAQQGVHHVLNYSITHDNRHYDFIVHGHLGNWVIELIPNANDPDGLAMRDNMRLIARESGRILNAETLDEALHIACDAARRITSFARVQIFQFLPDWSGKVIADSRAEHMSSFVGLHFPAEDIPRQARFLMQMVPYRGVFSVHDETKKLLKNAQFGEDSVDLTYALVRSCSTMHTAYLRNMGVEATFSVSLLQGDKLWGFISCHHDESRVFPFDLWSLLRDLGTALMSRINYETTLITSRKVLELRKLEVDLASTLRKEGDLFAVVNKFGPALMNFMNADGFAFQFDGETTRIGETPPEDFISDFLEWVQNNVSVDTQYNTSSLHKEWPEAKYHIDTACGVLLQPVAAQRACQLIWFRKPLSEKVEWAGQPFDKSKALGDDELAKLLPRNSFHTWIAQHNDFSLAWTDAELSIAKEILREILDILASVLALSEENTRLTLSEENTKLKSFAASAAAHDIKGPLRRIELALQFMEADEFDPDAIKQGHIIATKSAEVLKNVSAGILEFMSVPDKARVFSSVKINDVLADVESVVSTNLEKVSVDLHFDTAHSVTGEQSLLTSLFMNIINNSIKYSKPDEIARVNVHSMLFDERFVEISVKDNGIGIPAEYADRIFNPTERLNLKDSVEGSGMGLAICKRIVGIHNGSISVDTTYTDGACILVRLPRSEQ
ncbi:MAG: ATP-binding protein [Granulosicoccus sp.]